MNAPLHQFRRFRWSRPFAAGLFVMFGGAVMCWLPLGFLSDIVHAGVGAWAGLLCGATLLALGLAIWLVPAQRFTLGIASILVALASYPLSNLGGFVVGMVTATLGGCLAIAWDPDRTTAKPSADSKEVRA